MKILYSQLKQEKHSKIGCIQIQERSGGRNQWVRAYALDSDLWLCLLARIKKV